MTIPNAALAPPPVAASGRSDLLPGCRAAHPIKPRIRVPAIYVYETAGVKRPAGEGTGTVVGHDPAPALASIPEDIGIIPMFLDRSLRA